MAKWFKFSAFILAALMISCGVRAGDDKKKPEGGDKGEHHGNLFEKADTNHDGKIDAKELAAIDKPKLQEMLKKFDTNGDGTIDEKEIEAAKAHLKDMRDKRAGEHKDGGEKKAEEKK